MTAELIHFDARDGVRLEGILEWPPGGQVCPAQTPDSSLPDDLDREAAPESSPLDDLQGEAASASSPREDVRPEGTLGWPVGIRPEGPPAALDSAGATAQPARLRAVILTHTHPLQAGGHMYAHVLRGVAAAHVQRGFAVLRFNFRGVQGSAGAFGDGRAELLDVGGAADYLRAQPRIDPATIALFGYSFGARVCLPYAAGDPAIRALATLGMPARRFLHEPPRFHGPLLLVAGSADHVLPPEHIERFLALYPNAAAHILPGADHFYRAHTAAAGAAVAAFLDDSP